MTHQSSKKPVAIAVGTALAGGLLLSGSAFAVNPLPQGYLLGAQEAATAHTQAEGACGGDKARAEGQCGLAKADTDGDGRISRAEFDAAHPDKGDRFAAIDANGDGFIDQAEHDAHKAAGKADMEGKCGEGKCGGMA
ncbi:calcium-binding protein [Luteimonas wenzhouensis]|jgi:uncharacterized low-complexity protein|uniref:Calcium-binding protein n=1 Tax=Luteimonas wenzhouensis TaxID=2599615 RepID=A0A5C5U3T9_9GAMM|nr:calcium-binding protein [Luteimonas wenzhouensis]NLW97101.1 calcium-binding protein [Xanthomonadaceae bacterium]TWT20667.1 calcium-binding protein [Luteimonas wenzhouensis]